ncbi:MAG: hypothetical protein LBU85_06850 [Treponema sp.]|nr:hypothetical protein [Treponema sp.]
MRRFYIFSIFIIVAQWSVLAQKNDDWTPPKFYAYGGTDVFFLTEKFSASNIRPEINFGGGFEAAITNAFSLNFFLGYGIFDKGYEFLAIPRFYFKEALEKWFVGANLGANVGSNTTDYYGIAGLNFGYKFVLGGGLTSFAFEPSIGYDFLFRKDSLSGRINAGLTLGIAFGRKEITQEKKIIEAPPPSLPPPPDGIYIGIITFGPNATDITGGNPVHLDQKGQGLARLNGLLDTGYKREDTIGTALFYAEHLAIDNMKKAAAAVKPARIIPEGNYADVMIFTFTDGLDVSSTGLSLPAIDNNHRFAGESIDKYMKFVKERIDQDTIKDSHITTYITTIQGDDITNVPAFLSARNSLATDIDHIHNIQKMEQLVKNFENIAEEIVSNWSDKNLTIITPEYAPGTRVRTVFSYQEIPRRSDQVENARNYIEGEVVVKDGVYYLTGISYGGDVKMGIPQSGEVAGKIEGHGVVYVFPDFYRNKLLVNVRSSQWIRKDVKEQWQINSEYKEDNKKSDNVKRRNALIYLVLDNSSSIAPASVPIVQRAAKRFIEILQNYYWLGQE